MIKTKTEEEYKREKQTTSDTIKQLYGEVNTPFKLVEEMLAIIPKAKFKDPNLKWLDAGTGKGNFAIMLYFKLMEGLHGIIINLEERKNHIIKNMIYMFEIQDENRKRLREIFGQEANIYGDFLSKTPIPLMDIVIGNPPFNVNGKIKSPTCEQEKKNDGITVWTDFVVKAINILKNDTGILCFFIPSIWLKPDKKGIYDLLLQYKIEWLNCFNNTETNKIFGGNAQTPSCYFLLTKKETNGFTTIKDREKYVFYKVIKDKPIPIFGQEICKKFQKRNENCIEVIKTNMPPTAVNISAILSPHVNYPNVTTCKLNGTEPELVINYSNKKLKYAGIPKLILAHKMYGFPYLDKDGKYGISNRDNYIIIKDKEEDLIKLQKFLSTKTALYLFECTRYRMKYLEKYAFELIPDITKLKNFPVDINDETIAEYFELDENDINCINDLTKKDYKFFKN